MSAALFAWWGAQAAWIQAIILGVSAYIVISAIEQTVKRISRSSKSDTKATIPTIIEGMENRPSGMDALQHIVIEEQDHRELVIHKGRPERPIMYPIKLRNTRPLIVDIVGFNVNVLWNGESKQVVQWRAPDRVASNGLAVHEPFDSTNPLDALRIQPDSTYQLDVPVNIRQISNWPIKSPSWSARGTVYFKAEGQTGEKQFNFKTDDYRFDSSDWSPMWVEHKG
ncbi:MAG: hypothetical protein IH861_02935 [Chloroflexi bacterium]|nr:hypothetical protein [Chloroflexota bacterium]